MASDASLITALITAAGSIATTIYTIHQRSVEAKKDSKALDHLKESHKAQLDMKDDRIKQLERDLDLFVSPKCRESYKRMKEHLEEQIEAERDEAKRKLAKKETEAAAVIETLLSSVLDTTAYSGQLERQLLQLRQELKEIGTEARRFINAPLDADVVDYLIKENLLRHWRQNQPNYIRAKETEQPKQFDEEQ